MMTIPALFPIHLPWGQEQSKFHYLEATPPFASISILKYGEVTLDKETTEVKTYHLHFETSLKKKETNYIRGLLPLEGLNLCIV